ncbi:unnamed protein product [Mytilus edulis]|uniref:B box-type domain-containing protein n=1 Tax=Mytilus edulis TaxID=6550 RepID=A0A8S3SGH9_MYTED|nr:unnamed protein product [Mytilus edulis]
MATPSKYKEQFDDLLTCTICLETTATHIERIKEHKTDCSFGIKATKDSFCTENRCWTNEQFKGVKMCNSCHVKNKTKEAVSWCTTCEEAFCGQCEEYHKSFKITSKHTVINFKKFQSDQSSYQLTGSIELRRSCRQDRRSFLRGSFKALLYIVRNTFTRNMKTSYRFKKLQVILNSPNKQPN